MIAALSTAMALMASTPTLGTEAGACRPHEPGPAVIVTVEGLKDRTGRIKLELYPDNDRDFLADDNVLVAAGKAFARVDEQVPAEGPVELCIRAPRPGTYALSLLHDRNGDHRFNVGSDGIGFGGNPRLRWSKPHAAEASVSVGPGVTRAVIIPGYLHGFAMRREGGL